MWRYVHVLRYEGSDRWKEAVCVGGAGVCVGGGGRGG